MRGVRTYDLVYPEDGPDVDTSVYIAATVQRIEDDAVFPLVLILDDDSFLVFFRDEHRGLSGGAEGVDHDVIGEDVKFLLFLALDIGLPCQTDSMLRMYQIACGGLGSMDIQIDKSSFANISCDELGCDLNCRQ
jgi:hypothetical protein